LKFHQAHGKLATVTTVRPPARFGQIHIEEAASIASARSQQTGEGWINGGFFV
jgi:glucose-1-phosphate cytidylyltransferase